MKVKLIIFLTLLFLFFTLPSGIRAQESVDKKIDSVEQEIESLKKRKLAALEKVRNELKKEVQGLEQGQTLPAETALETPAKPAEKIPANGGAIDTAGTPKNNVVNAGFLRDPAPARGTSPVQPAPIKKAAAAAQPAPQSAGNTAQTGTSLCLAVQLEPDKYSLTEVETCNLAIEIVRQRFANNEAKRGMFISSANDSVMGILGEKIAQSADAKLDKAVKTFLIGSEAARTDKQPGADSKSAGTTSLAVKGGVPAFLAWALENGGAEGSRDGNTITFRVNPLGLADSLANWGSSNGLITVADDKRFNSLFRDKDDPFIRVLKNTSLGFSFDITRGTDPPTLIGSKQQLSAVSARYQFLNRRDPRNSRYKEDWAVFRRDQQRYTDKIAEILPTLITFNTSASGDHYRNADLEAWFQAANAAVTDVPTDLTGNQTTAVEAVRVILAQQIDKLPADKLRNNPALVAQLNSFFTEFVTLNDKLSEVLKKVANGEVITFEYTNYRNVNAPDLSNFRFIASKGFWEGADLTFNASLTMFNKKPTSTDPAANVKRIRDFDFTLQADIPFSSFIKRAATEMARPGNEVRTPLIGIPVLTFAGKYQRMQSDGVMPDGTVKTGTRGDLAFGQAKLTIPINFNGLSIKLPFSITMSNRTDLIKEKEIRGNFGFTLDIDPFFSALKNMLPGNPFQP